MDIKLTIIISLLCCNLALLLDYFDDKKHWEVTNEILSVLEKRV